MNVKETTKGNSGLKFVLAVSYGGRGDIVQACQRWAGRIEAGQLNSTDITESLLEQELETTLRAGDLGSPDLVIRTSGEQRISNFLLLLRRRCKSLVPIQLILWGIIMPILVIFSLISLVFFWGGGLF